MWLLYFVLSSKWHWMNFEQKILCSGDTFRFVFLMIKQLWMSEMSTCSDRGKLWWGEEEIRSCAWVLRSLEANESSFVSRASILNKFENNFKENWWNSRWKFEKTIAQRVLQKPLNHVGYNIFAKRRIFSSNCHNLNIKRSK